MKLGPMGEALATRFLRERGWTILARNFRFGRKEIDIVAERNGVLAFVEVKTRRGDLYGHPLEAITWKKRREIEQVAQAWLQRHPWSGETVRFDAIAVRLRAGRAPEVEHVEGAWEVNRRR